MEEVSFNNITYKVTVNYKNGFDKDSVKDLLTDYFNDFDYILGDWSYDKLRLKGFCNKDNSRYKKLNDKDLIDSYVKDSCAYGCRYFVLEKL